MRRFFIPAAVLAALALLALGAYAVGNITTDQASTAAPTSVNLSGVSAAAGSSFSFAKADHVHSLTGTLADGSLANAYSGVAACSAGSFASTLTRNAAPTCTSPAGNSYTWTAAETFSPSSGITTFNSSGATRGQAILTPMTSTPSGPSNGEVAVYGATTAMTAMVRLNGASQPFLTGGANGSRAVQTSRTAGCTTAASVGAICTVTVTWTTAFPDTSYTATCTGDTGTAGNPVVGGTGSKATTTMVVSTVALTAVAATFTTINCIAIHD